MDAPITRRAVAAFLALGLSACSSGPGPGPRTTDPTTGPGPSPQAGPSATVTAPSDGGGDPSSATSGGGDPSPAPYPDASEIPIGVRFSDPETGDSFSVISVLRHAPSRLRARTIAEGGEVLYLQVEAVPGDRPVTAIYGAFWYVLVDGAEHRSDIGLEAEVSESGRTPFDAVAQDEADPGARWVPFQLPPPRPRRCRGAYVRPELSREVEGRTVLVPEFRHEFGIPAG
ncbi:hypothetical protein [Brachybacterium hainanense]|uniref:DUF4352 domain-containing protein n=1 Tax=Brachybacterium hainanense TaxID=1541174 RepID=A0ABV6RA50_9MICO